jgi:hypothetical protein
MRTLKRIIYWTLGIVFGLPLAAAILVVAFERLGPVHAKKKAEAERTIQEREQNVAAVIKRRDRERLLQREHRARENVEAERAAFESEIKDDSLTLQNTWRQHPEISKEMRALVRGRRIQIGMPAALVRLSWGDPKRVNSTVTERGESQQWVFESSYVYIGIDGKVKSIQQTKGSYE